MAAERRKSGVDRSGYVYLFKADGGTYKIGKSKNPARRLKDFDTLPFNVRLEHTIRSNDAQWLETFLHERFSHRLITGEWYQLSVDEEDGFKKWTVYNRPAVSLSVVLLGGERQRILAEQETHKIFAAKLKGLREKSGMTQKALAENAGLALSAVTHLEQGLREPTWATVQAIARALGVSCEAFQDNMPGV